MFRVHDQTHTMWTTTQSCVPIPARIRHHYLRKAIELSCVRETCIDETRLMPVTIQYSTRFACLRRHFVHLKYTHMIVFMLCQMEGVRILTDAEVPPGTSRAEAVRIAEQQLKDTLEGMVRAVFGDVKTRWNEDYFPFTDPSLELEIYFNG